MCYYHVLVMVATNAFTNDKHKFYNEIVQAILKGGVDFSTKVGALCAHIF